jgi:hypothetical protein
MADLNKIISVSVDDNASAGLKKVDQSLTKVTQSTKNLSKETQSHTQSIVDNGGAMGLLNELTGGLAMTFKDASEAIGLAGVSLNSFKGIMIATGIGALVVAVGALAANWEAVGDALGITNTKLEKQLELQRELQANAETRRASQQEYIDTILLGIDSVIERQVALEKLADVVPILKGLDVEKDKAKIESLLGQYNDLLDGQEAIASKTKEVNELSKELLDTQNDAIGGKGTVAYANKEQALFQAKRELASLQSKELTLLSSLKLTQAEFDAAKKAAEDKIKLNELLAAKEAARIAALKKFNEDYYKKLQDLDADTEMKRINLQEKRALLELAELEGSEKDKLRIYEYYERLRIELRSKYRIQEEQEDKKKNDAFVQGLVTEWEEYKQNQFKQQEIKRLTDEAKFESEMMYWDNVYSITQTSQDLLAVLQDDSLIRAQGLRDALLISEKGLAIAGVWINEAQSTAMAKASANAVPFTTNIPGLYGPITIPNPMKPVAMAGAVKAGVTNKINAGIATAAILAQTIAGLNKRGSGGGGAGSGGVGNQAPQAQFNIVGSSGTNQLAATIGAQQNQPVNAYVVGTDVSTQQSLDRNRITNATFL